MDKKKIINNPFIYYSIPFLINLVIICSIFMLYGLEPFGQHNLLISDLGSQYIPFMTEFRNKLLSGTFNLYSFRISLGDNFLPVMSYYLLSPFNLLLVLFKPAQIPIAANIIIILKISTIGVTTAYFIKHVYGKVVPSNYIFTVAYSFCGFVAAYGYNLMWLDGLIMLPLVATGLVKLVRDKKPIFYTVTLFLTIIFNYYMGYMICLFSAGYFVYLFFENNLHKADKKISKRTIKDFIASSLTAGIGGAFILLPSMIGMLKTAKEGFKIEDFIPSIRFGTESLTQIGVGANTYAQHLQHAPAVFVTSVVIVLALAFFLSKNVNHQKKLRFFYLLLYVFLGMWVTTFNTIWHMFQSPAGFPFRNSFIFSFILVMVAFEAFNSNAIDDERAVVQSGLIVVVLLLIGYASMVAFGDLITKMFTINNPQSADLNSMILAIIFTLFSTWIISNRDNYQRFKFLLLVLVCFEVVINTVVSISNTAFGDQKNYEAAYKIEKRDINKARVGMPNGKRLMIHNSTMNEAFPEDYNNYNDPMLFRVNGASAYSSTLNKNTQLMMSRLGFFSRNVRRVSYLGATKITDALFGSYQVIRFTQSKGFKITDTQSPTMGMLADKRIENIKLRDNHPFENQNNVWQAVTNTHTKYLMQPKIKKYRHTGKKTWTYQVKMPINGHLYVLSPASSEHKSKIFVNGKYRFNRRNGFESFIVDGNYHLRGETIKVKIVTDGHVSKKNTVRILDNSKFNKSVDKVKQTQMDFTDSINKYSFDGKINVQNKDQRVLISIPYDEGWIVKDNGHRVNTKRVVDGIMSIKLNPGAHRISFHYRVPGMIEGFIISIITVICYIAYLNYRKRDLE